MSSFRAVKTVLAPVRWLLRYIMLGLTAIGLSAYVVRTADDEETAESTPKAEDPRGFPPPTYHPLPGLPGAPPAARFLDAVSTVELTHDERLWEAELTDDDTGF